MFYVIILISRKSASSDKAPKKLAENKRIQALLNISQERKIMNQKALQILEYDKIISQLEDYATSALGKALCRSLLPSS